MTRLCQESVRRFEESELWFARQGGAIQRVALDVGQRVVLRLPCGVHAEFRIRSNELETYEADFAIAVDQLARGGRSLAPSERKKGTA